jgi:hypothetical protein
MTIDKRISYEMQGGKKPARNYLGKQKTVSNVPVKWKSGPDAPSTELAYITKAEKDLLLKKNLHGSLKNGPNTGPDNIMSLDSQGDYTRDRSQDRARSQMSRGDSERAIRNEAHMKAILTGQKNIGQTTKTGPKTRKYAVPEYVNVKQPDGSYKNKYIGSGYKSYGTPSFWGNLFSRGAPGYRGIKGMPGIFGKKPGFNLRGRKDPITGQLLPDAQGQLGYYSDKENFGDTRDAMPFGIMGLIANAINKFKKPKDMTEFNKLGLYDERVNPDYYNDLGNELALGTTVTPVRNDFNRMFNVNDIAELINNSSTVSDPYQGGTTPFDPSIGNSQFSAMRDPQFLHQLNLDSIEALNEGYKSKSDTTPKKGIMEHLSDWNPLNLIFGTPAHGAELTDEELINRARKQAGLTTDSTTDIVGAGGEIVPDLSNADVLNQIAIQSGMPTEKEGFYGFRKDVATPGSASTIRDIQNYKRNPELEFGVKDIMGLGFDRYNQLGEEKVQSIYDMVNLPNQGPFIGARGGRVGYANGGLASLFTRRG